MLLVSSYQIRQAYIRWKSLHVQPLNPVYLFNNFILNFCLAPAVSHYLIVTVFPWRTDGCPFIFFVFHRVSEGKSGVMQKLDRFSCSGGCGKDMLRLSPGTPTVSSLRTFLLCFFQANYHLFGAIQLRINHQWRGEISIFFTTESTPQRHPLESAGAVKLWLIWGCNLYCKVNPQIGCNLRPILMDTPLVTIFYVLSSPHHLMVTPPLNSLPDRAG